MNTDILQKERLWWELLTGQLREYVRENDMIILGNREEDHLQAIEMNVSCIIVGMDIQVTENVLKLAHEKDIVVISSHMIRLQYQD